MIDILTQVVVTLVGWVILMLVCTNLIGFLVRRFFANPEMENIVADDDSLIREYQKHQHANKIGNIVAAALVLIFLIALYYVWNIGLVIAALMLMTSRVFDLFWEIKHGRSLQMRDMTRPRFYLLSIVLSWASLPVVWYSLYRL